MTPQADPRMAPARLFQACQQMTSDLALAALRAEMDGLAALFHGFAGLPLAQPRGEGASDDLMAPDDLMENVPV